jgi:sugar-specific transcriptional regulator TrmB
MEHIANKLQLIGITKREAEVYIALLHKKEFTAPEIAKITSVSRSKSYEILQNLVKKKLCVENYRNGIKVFSSIEPKIVFEKFNNEIEHKKNIAAELYDELHSIYQKNEQVSAGVEYIEVLTDKLTIRDRWLSILNDTKTELLVFAKPPYTAPLEENMDDEINVLKRKVKIKSLYEYGYISSKDEMEYFIKVVDSFKKEGEEVRMLRELPMKLAIKDEYLTMLALNDPVSMQPTITTMIIEHPSFSASLKKVFSIYWKEALSFTEFKNDVKSLLKNNKT